MLRSIFLYVVLWFFTPLTGLCQYVVASIDFEGLKKTQVEYFQTFVEIETGKELQEKQLKRDLQQLINLIPVTQAQYRLDTVGKEIYITFVIEESITLFPIASFGGIQGNFWYQLGFTDANLLGQGMLLNVYYMNNDRRDNFNVYFRSPALRGSPWGYTAGFTRFASVEPLYFDNDQTVFYNYTNTNISSTAIYRLGLDQYLEFGGTFFVEDYEKQRRHLGEMTPGPERLEEPKILTKFFHSYRRLTYHFYYIWGFYNLANFQTVYNFRDQSWFHIFLNDTRYYRRLGSKGNIATRLRLGLSTNNNSPFAPFVLDSYVNIRGVGNRVDRGTGAVVLNLEYRHTLLDMNSVAVQMVVFSDVGTWRNPGGDFSDLVDRDNLRHFVGGGVRLIYKKAFNAILRIDYGVDLYNTQQRGAVIGIGQYF